MTRSWIEGGAWTLWVAAVFGGALVLGLTAGPFGGFDSGLLPWGRTAPDEALPPPAPPPSPLFDIVGAAGPRSEHPPPPPPSTASDPPPPADVEAPPEDAPAVEEEVDVGHAAAGVEVDADDAAVETEVRAEAGLVEVYEGAVEFRARVAVEAVLKADAEVDAEAALPGADDVVDAAGDAIATVGGLLG